jgi:cytochrome c biogenesis protein CcmG/thiol:disulfide interchange protein DsbE
VNFFASWCAPCEVEHPVVKALAAKGVRIVGIAYKDSPDNAQAYLTRLGDPYAVRLVDRDGRAGIEFGVTGVPETFVVDTRGVILAKHTGPLTAQAAKTLAAKLR